jgi:hypothetical protein
MIVAFLLRSVELEDASQRIAAYPRAGAGYTSREIPLNTFEKDMLGDAQGYKFIYVYHGLKYAITLLDGTNNRQAVHDPRYCFRGAGWDITEDTTIDFSGGSARKLKLMSDSKNSEALFFYSTGLTAFSQPMQYWLHTTIRRWLRSYGGAEPILVMVQPVEGSISLDYALSGLLPLLPLP